MKELFRILMLLLKLSSSDTLVSNTTAKKKFGKPNERAFPALASARASGAKKKANSSL
jgi:hypothetical protein